MRTLFVMILLSEVVFSQTALKALAGSDEGDSGEAATVAAMPNLYPALPPLPKGKATVIGGTVRNLDSLRDDLTLHVYGGHPMKILYDERTEVYRDGKRISLHDLRSGDRISVETVLDGSNVFARSIHVLTATVEGECHGQVVSFERGRGELLVRDSLSSEPVKLSVTSSTKIIKGGQEQAAAGLTDGALVSVQFQPDGSGGGVAREVAILATPGNNFVFRGTIDFLDVHAGLLVLLDPRDNQRYEIVFDPQQPVSRRLREGADVTVNAGFDGTRYSAHSISVNSLVTK